MRLRIDELKIICRKSIETIDFGTRLTFIHGEMSSGKSSIPALVDFCLGSSFPGTPALFSELVSVQLRARMGSYDVLIERARSSSNIEVFWRTDDGLHFQCLAPIRAATNAPPIFGEQIYSFSDLILHLLGVSVIKVRRRTHDPESGLVRLSFRDLMEYVYLDQDHLDSDFFLLDVPIRKEKSQDAFRYFVGYMSERLNDLQCAPRTPTRTKNKT